MPSTIYNAIAELAADQYGYVTPRDVRNLGFDPERLGELRKRNQLEWVARGVYRVPLIPATPLDPYMLATLWPQGTRGTISHATALDLYGLSDVNPEKIHITVRTDHRPRRGTPRQYVVHHEDLDASEKTYYEGIPIVTPAKAIRQAAQDHIGPALVRQAIDDGRRRGLIRKAEASQLHSDLLGDR